MVENGAILYIVILFGAILCYGIYKLITGLIDADTKKAQTRLDKLTAKLAEQARASDLARQRHDRPISRYRYASRSEYRKAKYAYSYGGHMPIEHALRPTRYRGLMSNDNRVLTYHFERMNRRHPITGDFYQGHDTTVYCYNGRGWEQMLDVSIDKPEQIKETVQPPSECKSIW